VRAEAWRQRAEKDRTEEERLDSASGRACEHTPSDEVHTGGGMQSGRERSNERGPGACLTDKVRVCPCAEQGDHHGA